MSIPLPREDVDVTSVEAWCGVLVFPDDSRQEMPLLGWLVGETEVRAAYLFQPDEVELLNEAKLTGPFHAEHRPEASAWSLS